MTAGGAIRLVCGFGRCGTSLAMQMLAAGGAQVTGEYPAFEDDVAELANRGIVSPAWASKRGMVVKLLDPQHARPASDLAYKAVWLKRDFHEQARSQDKFARAMMGLSFGRNGRRGLEGAYQRDEPLAHAALQLLTGFRVPVIRFEHMLAHPRRVAGQFAAALDLPSLDLDAMVAVVLPRSPKCYPGLLEAKLLGMAA